MKVEVIKNEDHEIEFPCLMEAIDGNGLVVFMIVFDIGVVVQGDGDYPKGEFLDDWDMQCFKPFTGKLVLSNE